MRRSETASRRPRQARGIRKCRAESSSAFKRLQNIFRQWGMEVLRHGELAFGQTDGARLGKWRWVENGEQTRRLVRQGLRAFGRNTPVVNLHFNGQIAHATKLLVRSNG